MEMKSTVKGYDFFEVSSAMQKAIRRNDPKLAGYFALELYHSGYAQYVWKRLLTVSAEDCYGETITTEIYNLHRSFMLINDGRPDLDKGRIFISKAVIILCRSPKCRDSDHLQNLIYDRNNVLKEEIGRSSRPSVRRISRSLNTPTMSTRKRAGTWERQRKLSSLTSISHWRHK